MNVYSYDSIFPILTAFGIPTEHMSKTIQYKDRKLEFYGKY